MLEDVEHLSQIFTVAPTTMPTTTTATQVTTEIVVSPTGEEDREPSESILLSLRHLKSELWTGFPCFNTIRCHITIFTCTGCLFI